MNPKNSLDSMQEVLKILHMNQQLPIPDAPDPEILEFSLAEAERKTLEFFQKQERDREEARKREEMELVPVI